MKKILFATVVLCLASCTHTPQDVVSDPNLVDLDSIKRRGTLKVVTDYNTINYFVHKDVAVGYQYELVNEYARQAGLTVEISVCNDEDKNLTDLHNNKVDLIATTLIADSTQNDGMSFTVPYGHSFQVLVEKNNTRSHKTLRSLAEDTVSVLANSYFERTLRHFNDTTDTTSIIIDPIEHYDVEQILQLVAEGEVPRTLCMEITARANRWYFPNLVYDTKIGNEKDLAWGIRPQSTQLLDDINQWLSTFQKTPKFKQIYRKYIIDPREQHNNIQSTSASTYVDTFEEIVRKHATDKRYNWIMISSVIYQESHFNPNARSWAGATGLMQLMPETARRFGVTDITDPEQNIEAGISFLMWIDKRLETYVPNAQERVKFTLAAYNVGLGHIMDAIRLAKVIGLKPDVWYGNAEVALLHKANPTYYSNAAVKHGYCRGTETINYVRSINERYKNYRAALHDK